MGRGSIRRVTDLAERREEWAERQFLFVEAHPTRECFQPLAWHIQSIDSGLHVRVGPATSRELPFARTQLRERITTSSIATASAVSEYMQVAPLGGPASMPTLSGAFNLRAVR